MRRPLFAMLLLACAFACLSAWPAVTHSQTYDEALTLVSGYQILKTGDFHINRENPPLGKLLEALPVRLLYDLPYDAPRYLALGDGMLIGQEFLYHSGVPAEKLLVPARMMTVLVALAALALAAWWAYRLWGAKAALVTMAFGAFDPTMIAHGSLVTTDAIGALTALAAVYAMWEYLQQPGRARMAAVGISIGLAVTAKYSNLAIAAVVVSAGVACALAGLRIGYAAGGSKASQWVPLGAMLGCAAGVIPFVYRFNGWAGFLPWLRGLEVLHRDVTLGRASYLFGEIREHGRWSYFPAAMLMKTPLGTLAAFLLGGLTLHRKPRLGVPEWTTLVGAPAAMMAAALVSHLNIGIRHVMSIFPFMFILAGRVAVVETRRPRTRDLVLLAMAAATALSSVRVSPHQLAYFNELAGGPRSGWLVMGDSNVDWGQDLGRLAEYLRRERPNEVFLSYFGSALPSHFGLRYRPLPGDVSWDDEKAPAWSAPVGRTLLAVSVHNLQGTPFGPRVPYAWLQRRKPTARIGWSIMVYDLTHDPAGIEAVRRTCAEFSRHGG